MNFFRRIFSSTFFAYLLSISAVYAKPIEDVFSEMLAIRETDPAGFWAMVCSIGLLFSLAFGLMALTMGYYVKHWFSKKK